jgi:hypothetical protein
MEAMNGTMGAVLSGTMEKVVREARSWIGTPYRHQASLKGVGCDVLAAPFGEWIKLRVLIAVICNTILARIIVDATLALFCRGACARYGELIAQAPAAQP